VRSRIIRGSRATIVALCLTLATPSLCRAQQCVGDCNGDGRVTINELIAYIDDELDGGNRCTNKPPPDVCDPGRFGVYILCFPIAIGNALAGCATSP
jgi:hypothetical protein